jgi:hypothetical protein
MIFLPSPSTHAPTLGCVDIIEFLLRAYFSGSLYNETCENSIIQKTEKRNINEEEEEIRTQENKQSYRVSCHLYMCISTVHKDDITFPAHFGSVLLQ